MVHERGAYAHYVNDKEPTVALVLTLQRAEAGRYQSGNQGMAGRDFGDPAQGLSQGGPNSASALVDVGRLPRLEGAKEQAAALLRTAR